MTSAQPSKALAMAGMVAWCLILSACDEWWLPSQRYLSSTDAAAMDADGATSSDSSSSTPMAGSAAPSPVGVPHDIDDGGVESDAATGTGAQDAAPATRPEVPLELPVPAPPQAPRRPAVPPDALDISTFGAIAGSDCTAQIQLALDSATTGGTVLVPPANKPYLLRAAGPSPFQSGNQFALRVPSGVTLFIAAGAVLKLDDAQQSDTTGPIDLIVFNGESVTITGGGTILGNAGGQTQWTGRGSTRYQQIGAGCLIRGFTPLSHVRVSDLYLRDSFSNPVNINADDDVTLERLATSGNGEGPQVIGARQVTVTDLDHDDFSDVSQGDGVELSNVDGFLMARVRVRASAGGLGSALDLYGCRNGVVEDFSSEGWDWGIDVHDFPNGMATTDNVEVRQSWVAWAAGSAVLSNELAIRANEKRGRTRFDKLRVTDSGIGVQVLGDAHAQPLTLTQVLIERCGFGVYMDGSRAVRLEASRISEITRTSAVHVVAPQQAPPSRLELIDMAVNDNRGYGIAAWVLNASDVPPQILIEGGDYTRNDSGAYFGLPSDSVVKDAIPPWP